ncbi:hypothetical protein IKE67_00425 [bacterium]|nr:hypothetical protein [bacterium]
MIERIVSSLSYLTSGVIGFIWLILGVLTKSSLRPFMKYHIFQSIFLSMGYFLLVIIIEQVSVIINFIPYVRNIFSMITFPFVIPIIFGLSIIQILIYTLLFYLAVTSFMGRYSYIPWISEIIKKNVR